MSEDTRKALDLDELYGQTRAIKVKWGEKEYELMRLEVLGPKEIVRFQGMQKRSVKLQNAAQTGELSAEESVDIEQLFDDMLKIICKNFPVNSIPFPAKVKALEFYITETQGKKALEVALSHQTGETPSPS